FLLVVEVGEKQGEELTGAVLEDRVMRRVERRDHRLEQMHLRILPPRHRRRPSLLETAIDRKSTRLNSSHLVISYAVFCLKETTELQSPCNLVCRLLLEKKNNSTSTPFYLHITPSPSKIHSTSHSTISIFTS